jgi:hypothetical protein
MPFRRNMHSNCSKQALNDPAAQGTATPFSGESATELSASPVFADESMTVLVNFAWSSTWSQDITGRKSQGLRETLDLHEQSRIAINEAFNQQPSEPAISSGKILGRPYREYNLKFCSRLRAVRIWCILQEMYPKEAKIRANDVCEVV